MPQPNAFENGTKICLVTSQGLICLYPVWVVAVDGGSSNPCWTWEHPGTISGHRRNHPEINGLGWIGLVHFMYSYSRTKISPFWGGLTAHVCFSTFWDVMILPRRYVHPDTAASRHAGPPALQKGHERITKSLLLNPLPTDLDLFSSGSREYTSKSTAECSCWGSPLGVPPTGPRFNLGVNSKLNERDLTDGPQKKQPFSNRRRQIWVVPAHWVSLGLPERPYSQVRWSLQEITRNYPLVI